MKKYEFTGETKKTGMRTLHRIRALRDIPEHGVKAGYRGGWIEKKDNLSQSGSAWVADEAWVIDSARVSGEAWVSGSALVSGEACVRDSARVSGEVWVSGSALVSGEAWVRDSARVSGSALVSGEACVRDSARVSGSACVRGEALIKSTTDCLTIGAIGSRNDTTTFYRDAEGGICVSCGCFGGSIDKFERAVKKKHAGTKHEKTYLLAIELAKAQIGTDGKEEKEPNRFQCMKQTHPKQWDYCIHTLGLGEVLDYIGVKYE